MNSSFEYREIKIESLVEKNAVVYIELVGLEINELKRITQQYGELLRNESSIFYVGEDAIDALDSTMQNAVNMLITRGLFNKTQDISSFLDLGKQGAKVYYLSHSAEKTTQIISLAKKRGLFVSILRVKNGVIEESVRKKSSGSSKQKTERHIENAGASNSNNTLHREQSRRKTINEENSAEKKDKNKQKRLYRIKQKPDITEVAKIDVEKNLAVGDVVYDETGKEYVLKEKVLNNNGASSFRTDVEGIWAKIYNPNELNTFLEAKINRMVINPLNYDGICWPLSRAMDSNNVFRGYFMKASDGEALHICVLKRAGIEKNFPNWDKVNLCNLTITILDKIKYLHNNGVLMGCINPAAIRVVNDYCVYFTDTDNYQIEGYPSYAYNISFTPPELLGRRVYLTNIDSENFAIAELVFMIMMTGKTPYAVGINGNPESEIKKMKFPYSNRQIHGNVALPGMWRFMWSHLTPFKNPFYETFQKGGKFNSPSNRRNTDFWIKLTKEFRDDLDHPADLESLKLYPRTFKRSPKDEFYKCKFCGTEHPRFYFSDLYFNEYRICNNCIDKKSDVSFTCVDCGKTYYYTNRTALFHKQKKEADSEWRDQKHCRDCKQKKLNCSSCGKEFPFFKLKGGMCLECRKEANNRVYQSIRCKQCGRLFDFTYGDRDFYIKKGYSTPSRCPDCRKSRNSNGNSSYTNLGNGNGNSGNGFWSKLFGL